MELSNFIGSIEQLYGHLSDDEILSYELCILYKSDYIENDIYTVHFKNSCSENRLGWLIPFNALISKEHKCSNNTHFQFYAKLIAVLLKGYELDSVSDDMHCLILKKDRLTDNQIDSTQQLVASVRKYGYQWAKNNRDVYNNTLLVSPRDSETGPNKLIVIKSVHIESVDDKYLFKLFYEHMPKQEDLYARFLLLYQCIELLIESEFVESVNELIRNKNSLGSLREKISKSANERLLINNLLTRAGLNSTISADELNLVEAIFGEHREKSYYANLQRADMIYDIRNALVHSYHKYELDGVFRSIVDTLECYIVLLVEKIEEIGGFDRSVIGTR